jgi:hypothetical protein
MWSGIARAIRLTRRGFDDSGSASLKSARPRQSAACRRAPASRSGARAMNVERGALRFFAEKTNGAHDRRCLSGAFTRVRTSALHTVSEFFRAETSRSSCGHRFAIQSGRAMRAGAKRSEVNEASEDDRHRDADDPDGERASHADRKRLHPDALEHREVRVQSDGRHRGAQ